MITVWLPRRMRRARVPAGPLPRLLGLAVVLFAVVVMHGAIPESAGGHLVTSPVAPATTPSEHRLAAPGAHLAVPAADTPGGLHDGRGDHGTGHPAEHCASAQPNQGPALNQPRFAASFSEAATPDHTPTARRAGAARPSDRSSAIVRSLVVRQI